MGIDAYGFDIPHGRMIDALRRGERARVFPAHRAGWARESCHVDKLANLDKLPRPRGFTVSLLPVMIEGGVAGDAAPWRSSSINHGSA